MRICVETNLTFLRIAKAYHHRARGGMRRCVPYPYTSTCAGAGEYLYIKYKEYFPAFLHTWGFKPHRFVSVQGF